MDFLRSRKGLKKKKTTVGRIRDLDRISFFFFDELWWTQERKKKKSHYANSSLFLSHILSSFTWLEKKKFLFVSRVNIILNLYLTTGCAGEGGGLFF